LVEGSTHKRIRHKIVKIGKLEGYDAKTEWPPRKDDVFDGVWMIPRGGEAPTHVFEVQVGGNPNSALGKLQRARRRWGKCEIRLVAPKDQIAGLRALAEKTLSEQDWKACKLIDMNTIGQAVSHLIKVRDIRREIGYEPCH